MKTHSLVPMTVAAIALVAYAGILTKAQDDSLTAEQRANLEEAIQERGESVAYAEKVLALKNAQAAEQAAIAAIPEIRSIDSEIQQLRDRIRELAAQRKEVIDQHAAVLRPYRSNVESAEQDFFSADPVRRVLSDMNAQSESGSGGE